LGTARRLQRDFDGAARYYQDSLALSQRSGQQRETAACLRNWGSLAYEQGDYHQAQKYQQEALAIWRQVGNEPEIASSLCYLGYIATAEGEHQRPQARQYFSQALQLALKHRLAPVALDVFVGVAELVAPAGEAPRAVDLLALVEHHPASTHETREKARMRLSQLSAAMPIPDIQTARMQGQALDWREAASSLITQLNHTRQGLTPTVGQPQVGHNLPAQSTPFIGREEELAGIVNKLTESDTRLLTLIGPGGIGKTRLSIQAAAELAARHSHHFPHGVYFVPLAPLTEPEAIVPALAKALDISLYAERAEPRQQLLNYLRPQKVLLLLDNFEHLLEPASIALLNDILATAPGVRLLTTSRERLNLQGERVLLLAGLDTPEDGKITWSRYSALHLFRESARRVRPDFELNSENLAAVIRICRLVQGMPLAIVLAGAWLELLGPDEIVAEIEQSFDFLESGWHDLPQRQRSLRAVFDTSWKLLDEAEQAALSALTVFQGGFTRDAAQAVVATSPKTLLRLVHKCWLEREANGRFQIHELLRQYAAEKLAADESHERQVRDQHAAYFAGQLQKWYEEMRGPNSAEAFVAAAADTANVQAAWRWLVARRRFETIVRQMLPGFFRYCEIRIRAPLLVPLVEMTRDALAENESQHPKFLAILLTVQAAFNRGGVSIRFEVFDIILPMYKEALDQAWTIASERGLLPEMGVWSIVLAWLYGWTRNLEDGLTALTALLSHVRQHGDRWELAFAMQCLGHLQYKVLGWENAGQNLSEALHLFQETGDKHEIGFTQRLLGILRLMQQRSAEAKLHLQAAQTRLENVGDLEVAAEVNWHLADVHFRLGELDEAFRYLRALRQAHLNLGRTEAANRTLSRESYEALRYSTIDHARETRRQTLALAREVDDTFSEAWYIWEMGEICRVAGEEEAARRWYDKAKGHFERIPDDNGAAFYHRGLGDLAHARGDYQEAQRQFRLSLELAQQMRHSWAESYAAAGLSRALLASGQPEAAREPLLTALQIARQTADTGLILLILARIADWCAATGGYERAVALAALVVNHHASWNETKAQAKVVLTAASARLPGKQAVAAQKRGKRFDPGETAVQLIEELAE
ncbi:MAG TPA: tetratricopeptide repeat protein, partial [Anaerolineae bacterium]